MSIDHLYVSAQNGKVLFDSADFPQVATVDQARVIARRILAIAGQAERQADTQPRATSAPPETLRSVTRPHGG